MNHRLLGLKTFQNDMRNAERAGATVTRTKQLFYDYEYDIEFNEFSFARFTDSIRDEPCYDLERLIKLYKEDNMAGLRMLNDLANNYGGEQDE